MFFRFFIFVGFYGVVIRTLIQNRYCLVHLSEENATCNETYHRGREYLTCDFNRDQNITTEDCNKSIEVLDLTFSTNTGFEGIMSRYRDEFIRMFFGWNRTVYNITIEKFNGTKIDQKYLQDNLNNASSYVRYVNISILHILNHEELFEIDSDVAKMNFHFLRFYIKYSSNETILFFNKTKPTAKPTTTSIAFTSIFSLTTSTTVIESLATLFTTQTQTTLSATHPATDHQSTSHTLFTEGIASPTETEFTTTTDYATNTSLWTPLQTPIGSRKSSVTFSSSKTSTLSLSITKHSNELYLLLLIPLVLVLLIIVSAVSMCIWQGHLERLSERRSGTGSEMSSSTSTQTTGTHMSTATSVESNLSSANVSAIYLSPVPAPRNHQIVFTNYKDF